uniref:CC domain-containing protein n=1 Tax=Ascaris lumbricoides TaxID=6252 RepID=A0A0M3I7S3_ASCLU
MKQFVILFIVSVPFAAILVLSTATVSNDSDGILPVYFDVDDIPQNGSVLSREKRQIGCPMGCFSGCQTTLQCQSIAPQLVCLRSCCCVPSIAQIPQVAQQAVSLATACDGGPAVAACINGLCGQGYFCNARGFCCRCQSGNTSGPCINGLCPAGYACNTNNFCCPLGSGTVLGPCINGQCPTGYSCGAGNLCYPTVAVGKK